MHSPLKWLSSTALAAAALTLAVASPATATSSSPVAGNAVPTSATLTARTADGNVIIDGVGTHAWTGSFSGTSTVTTHFIEHPSGTLTFQGVITFTGTTPCGVGTLQFNAAGEGPLPGPISGHATTIDDANASVPIHAELNLVLFLTPAGAVVSYTGDAHCG
jgi:hypothetical protein